MKTFSVEALTKSKMDLKRSRVFFFVLPNRTETNSRLTKPVTGFCDPLLSWNSKRQFFVKTK